MLHATFLLLLFLLLLLLSVAPWNHSMKRFREAQLLLVNHNHKTCLKCSILERMFDFKNVQNNFISKTTLIRFYKQNPILWNNADPNYKNKVKRSLIKVKLVTIFDGKFPEEFLEICFHSLRTSMIRQIKKSANGNESKCKFYKHFDFLVGSLTEKKNEFESAEIQQLIDIYRENEPLWNDHLKEYSDRNLREVKLRELMEQFEEKFTAAKIKQQ